ncbi:ABC transporter permease [Kineosporia succinea]|uniref:ABC transport system permease protein n=1 Tax=Kineosporia succinea TaxID=84632 RepID=A0ABT9P1T6_9ACTN|nr:ABC transporter permease [Kineosporia succinea]MDP9826633.1 putative ABC transport system permease protein [Kineosporia succinea]
MTGWFPAGRVALRLARRDVWRNRGRSALVALMIALPVLGMSAVSVIARSDELDPQDHVRVALGEKAQALVYYGDGEPISQRPDDPLDNTAVSRDEGELTRAEFLGRARRIVSDRDVLITDDRHWGSRSIRRDGRLIDARMRELDYDTPGLGGLIEQREGRAPQADGEVVATGTLVRDSGVRVGDVLTYRPPGSGADIVLTVVGIVGGYDVADSSELIGRTGGIFPADLRDATTGPFFEQWDDRTLLVTGPDPVTWDQVLDLNQLGSTVLSRAVVENPPPSSQVPHEDDLADDYTDRSGVGIVAVVVGLVLLQIALLAGPAIAVGARRNQRSLALLAATGAQARHLRAVLLATNGLIGLVSSLVAAGLGVAVGRLAIAGLRSREWTLVRTDVHLSDLAVLVVAGAGTAVAASLVPARQAARMDVVAALTGRRGYAPPKLRVSAAAFGVAVAGVVVALVAAAGESAFLAVAGLATAEVGLVAASGTLIALAARSAVRMPFAVRFALRDAARQRARTAPAVAAVLAAVAGGSTGLVFLAAQNHHDDLIYRASSVPGGVWAMADTADGQGQPAAEAAEAEATLRRELPIDSAAAFFRLTYSGDVFLRPTRSPGARCPDDQTEGMGTYNGMGEVCSFRTDSKFLAPYGEVLFDDGTALRVVTGGLAEADYQALAEGFAVTTSPELIWPDGTVHVEVERMSADDPDAEIPVVRLKAVEAQGAGSLAGVVYPIGAAKALGVEAVRGGVVATTSRMPTSEEEAAAEKELKETLGMYVTVERGYTNDLAVGLVALLIASSVVSLIGTFTAVGLAAAESRADVSTLAAVGAGPGVRRRLAAAQSGVIATLGTVLGVFSGVVGGWVLVLVQQDNEFPGETRSYWELVLPWELLLTVGVGIPLLAGLIAFAGTRSRLPLARRIGQ